MQTYDLSVNLMFNTTEGFKNPNGCPLPTTFFTLQKGSTCKSVQRAYNAGSEIADHTVTHPRLLAGSTTANIPAEIKGVRDWLINNCSLPADSVTGFRTPHLVSNPDVREALYKQKFLYDSTINEHWPMPTSANGKSRLWPYTMDDGIPQDCSFISGNTCSRTERYPGMWQVPVWAVQTDAYPTGAYAMDYCDG